jgi:hypothetical protein
MTWNEIGVALWPVFMVGLLWLGVQRVRRSDRRSRAGEWTEWWLLALMVLAFAAHAQPTEWRSYRLGSVTNYSGTDQNGRQWTARSYDLGSTTYSTITDPDGRERRCSSYTLGSQRITRCE